MYPSPVDNGMVLATPMLLAEANASFSNPIRGELRGLADPCANLSANLLHKQVLSNLIGSSRSWLLVGFCQQGALGHAAFDITGPWA